MVTRIALLAALAAPANIGTQPATLHIVVIKGEDAVNIIQQKTAVAPIVEVRDRNNLPVSGATVTFTLAGNASAFAGGAQTLTVVTNAAGQAAAVGLSPIASGAVQINVAAAFQGQTAITAIAQTNFMTAAEAAGTKRGGLSAKTIVILGASAAAGGLILSTAGGSETPAVGSVPTAPVSTTTNPTTTNPTTPLPVDTQPRTFSGPLSGPYVYTGGDSVVGPDCVVNYALNGTLTLTLTQSGVTISGNGVGTGSLSQTSSTCPRPGSDTSVRFSGLIIGTVSSFSFTQPNLSIGTPGFVFSGSTVFTGSLANNTVTGTVTINESSQFGSAHDRRTGTYQVTLR